MDKQTAGMDGRMDRLQGQTDGQIAGTDRRTDRLQGQTDCR